MASQFGGTIVNDAPQSQFGGTPVGTPPTPSFGDNMVNNFKSGVNSAANLVSPSYYSSPSPQTAGDILKAKHQAGAADFSDYVNAFMEGGSNSPVGQGFNAVGGTLLNPVTTAVGNYINPAIAKVTGATPNEVAAAEMFLPIGLKGAKSIPVPEVVQGAFDQANAYTPVSALKSVASGIADRASGLRADTPEDLTANIDNNYSKASQTINDAHNEGAVLTPDAGQSIIDQVKTELTNNRFNPAKHVDTAADVTDLQSKADNGNLTLGDIDDFRKSLGDTIKDNTTKLDGPNADAFMAVQAKNALLNGITNLGEDAFQQGSPDTVAKLQTGINQYAQAARYEKVANIAKNADGDSNAFARGLKNFTKNDNNSKGFTDEEWQSLEDASSRGIGGSIENWLGKFGVDANRAILPAAMSLAKVGGAAVIPGGAPLVGLGTLARATSKLATKGGYQNALDTIMNRDTTVNPVDPQITGMRARVNAANGQQPVMDPQLQLPSPAAITPPPSSYAQPQISYQPNIISNEMAVSPNGQAVPVSINDANNAAVTRQQMSNMGLTPDILKQIFLAKRDEALNAIKGQK